MAHDIFPVGKWRALTDGHGNMISQMYDWIAPFQEGRYRAVRTDGKYGLLRIVGDKVTEILKPRAITPPSIRDLIRFEVTVVKLETEQFLIDEHGNMLEFGIGVWIIDKDLVSIEKTSNRFTLYNPMTGSEIGDYSEIEVFENYIETHEGNLRGLLTRELVEVFKAEFQKVEKFGTCFIATKPDGSEVLGNPNWEKNVEAEKVHYEKNGFILIQNKTRYGYVEVSTGRRTQFIFTYAEGFNSEGYTKVEHPLYGICWMDKKFNFLPAREE